MGLFIRRNSRTRRRNLGNLEGVFQNPLSYFLFIALPGSLDMKASVGDLRYKIKDVLEALERRETIRVLYNGQLKGTIIPVSNKGKIKMADHPFFGMKRREHSTVPEQINILRGGRYNRCPM
jgi:hypothetical protein